MTNRKYYIAGVILVALLCGIIALILMQQPVGQVPVPASQPDKLSDILSRGTLIIATDSDYPPHSQLKENSTRSPETGCAPAEYTSGQFSGYNIALAVEIARRLGVEPCFVTPTRTQITSGNWADGWDIHIGAMAITSERLKVLYFTQPYYAGPVVLFVHKDNSTYSNVSDLSGKRVGVCAGCILERYLEESLDLPGQKIEFSVKNATIVAYDNEAKALEDLGAGDGLRLDAVLTNEPTGEDLIKNGVPIKVLGKPLFYDFDAAAIDQKSGRDPGSFVRKVTQIIQEMHQDGTLLNLSLQYYGKDLITEAGKYDISALNQLK